MNLSLIITEIVVRGGIDTTAGFYTDAMLDRDIDRAYKWATSYKKWPFTEYMDKSGVFTSGTEENSYPNTNFKTDNIRALKIGSKLFQKVNFYDYLQFREDFPDNDDKIFSDYGRTLYINPNAATGTMYAYGQLTQSALSVGTSDTIFAGYDEEGDDAIVDKTIGLLYIRGKKRQEAADFEARAQKTLDELWGRVKDEQAMYQGKNRSLFKRYDVVRGRYYDDDINNPLRW